MTERRSHSAARIAHRLSRWAIVASLVAAAGACGSPDTGAGQPATVSTTAPTPTVSPTPAGLVNAPRPVRIRIPRLGVDAAMDPIHLDAAHVLVPPAYGRAGWYMEGPEPGEVGRAVVAAHVDSKTGPDVFARLREARKGDRVQFRLADGTTLTFVVYAREEHPRNDFPTSRVYGTDTRPELRLITCAGPYDRAHGGYQDNLIVFARLAR